MFAALGYGLRRSALALRGRAAKLAALAVMLAGLFAINTGLVLGGSPLTAASIRASMANARTELQAEAAGADPKVVPEPPTVTDGTQELRLDATNWAYEPAVIHARADIPTRLTVRTDRTRGCTRAFVIASLDVQEILPESGDTAIDLGRLRKGRLAFTCAMGMYGGVIQAT